MLKIFSEKELIDKGFTKIDKILYAKNISKDQINDLIKDFYNLKSTNPQEKHNYKKSLFDDLEVYRKYKDGYLHVSYFSVTRSKKKSSSAYNYSFTHDTTKGMSVTSITKRNSIQTNNIFIVRKFNMGDENTELTFKVGDIESNMEKRRVSILKDEEYSPNFELHHIATIDNSSRDKTDHDPSKWIRTTDLTHFMTVDDIYKIEILSNTIIVNDKSYPIDTVKIEIINDNMTAYIKQKSAVERIKELMGIMIIPIEEHSAFHKAIGKKANRNMGYSGYNLECLPHAIRSKENYDSFIKWVCENYKFKSSLFESFEDHIKNLEVE